MYRTILLAALWGAVVAAAPAAQVQAGLIDFQELTDVDEGAPVPDLSVDGVLVSFENAIVARYGAPLFAFTLGDLDDIGWEAPFYNRGNIFITDALGDGDENLHAIPSGPIIVNFDAPVTGLRFLVADIDLGEEVTAQVSDAAGELLGSIVTSDGGDGLNTLFDFGAITGIHSLSIDFSKTQANGNAAIGIDNIEFAAVPEPSTVALWSVLGVAVTWAARRRRAARCS